MSRARVMERLLLAACLLVPICSFASGARASSIGYSVISLGGDDYRYVYSVSNDGSLGTGVALQLFDVLFDPTLYDESSLAVSTPSPPGDGWDQIFLASSPGVSAAYDALALTGGVADGATLGGFAVDFHWLGAGTPGAQPYQIFDPDSFALLGEGVTGVPEPAEFWLLALGLGPLLASKRLAR